MKLFLCSMTIKSKEHDTVLVGLGEQRRAAVFLDYICFIARCYHLLTVALRFFQGNY